MMDPLNGPESDIAMVQIFFAMLFKMVITIFTFGLKVRSNIILDNEAVSCICKIIHFTNNRTTEL